MLAASSVTSRSKRAPASLGSVRQHASGRSHCAPFGANGRPFEIGERRVVRRHHPGARARLDRHVAHASARPSIDSARIARRAYSITWPVPPAAPILRDDGEDHVLGAHAARRARPRRVIRMVFGLRCQQRLRRQHVLDLGRADAEGERAERAVGARCGCRRTPSVMPGRVMPCSGPMTCTMPCRSSPRSNSVMPARARFARSVSTMRRSRASADPRGAAVGRHVVVGGAEGRSGAADGEAAFAQPSEHVARAVVHEVAVDVEERQAVRRRDDVPVPDLLEQGFRHQTAAGAGVSSRNCVR